MNKNIQIIKIIIIAILAAVAVWQVITFAKGNLNRSENVTPGGSAGQISSGSGKSESSSGLETQTSTEGPVSVKVTPLELSGGNWKFEVFLNTHSVELNYDLTELAVLTDSSGNQTKPSSWEGDPPEGHHRSGTLIFNTINPKPASINLKIREIGGIEERNFTWKISP